MCIALEPFTREKLLPLEVATQVESLLIQAFSSRRKKLRNTIGSGGSPNQIEAIAMRAGISLQQRPQEVSPRQWLMMARNFNHVDAVAKSL